MAANEPMIKGEDWVISFDKKVALKSFDDYLELLTIGSRWTSTNLQNHYLRVNSDLSKKELQQKLAKILDIPEEAFSIQNPPFLLL